MLIKDIIDCSLSLSLSLCHLCKVHCNTLAAFAGLSLSYIQLCIALINTVSGLPQNCFHDIGHSVGVWKMISIFILSVELRF